MINSTTTGLKWQTYTLLKSFIIEHVSMEVISNRIVDIFNTGRKFFK